VKKPISIALASAAIVGGGLGVAALNPLHLASAQQPSTTTASSSTTTTTTAPAATAGPLGRGAILQQVLDDLVKKGTITADQAKAITDALQQAAKNLPRHGGPGFRGLGDIANTVATTIGVSVDDLRTAIRNGDSIAKVAQDHKVDPQKVIDALVAEANKRIDAAVTAGKLTADQATQAKTRAATLAKDIVNGTRPFAGGLGPRGGRGGGFGPRGGFFPGPQVPRDGTTSTTTA
jgi:polyhydroxyalkanoate synthesis regulator phasin